MHIYILQLKTPVYMGGEQTDSQFTLSFEVSVSAALFASEEEFSMQSSFSRFSACVPAMTTMWSSDSCDLLGSLRPSRLPPSLFLSPSWWLCKPSLLWPPNSDQLVWLFSSRLITFASSPMPLSRGHSIFSLTSASKVITSVFTLFVLGWSALHCWRVA